MRMGILLGFLVLCGCGEDSTVGTEIAAVTDVPPAFQVTWVKSIGGGGDQYVNDVFAGAARAFLVGQWNTTLDFHDGVRTATDQNWHAYLAATDTSGQLLWHRAWAGTAAFTRVVGTAADDPIVAGGRNADADVGCGLVPQGGDFLANYDGSSGTCLWMRVWPASSFYRIAAIVTLPDGDLAVTGDFAGTVDLGGGNTIVYPGSESAVFVARLDPRGVARWARVLGDPRVGSISRIDVADITSDTSGGVYLTGTFAKRVDLAGQTYDFGTGPLPFYVLALDGSGTARWRYVDPDHKLMPHSLHAAAGRLGVSGLATASFQFAGQDFPVATQAVFALDFGLDGHTWWGQAFSASSTAVLGFGNVVVDAGGKLNLMGSVASGTLDIAGAVIDTSDSRKTFLIVLDANGGAVQRANALGDDGSSFAGERLSFGPTGLRLLGGEIFRTEHLGNRVFSATGLDGAYMNLTH